MGKVRMADIAAKVGVSTVTVHNALSGNKGVSDEMREKIQKVADELGYHQMTAAAKRERNKGGLRNIGVIISEKYLAAYTTFYWKMYQELVLVAADKNCMAAVEILKQDMEENFILPRIQEEHTVDALIVMGEISREYIHFMKKHTDVPVIFLDFYDKELAKDAVIADIDTVRAQDQPVNLVLCFMAEGADSFFVFSCVRHSDIQTGKCRLLSE